MRKRDPHKSGPQGRSGFGGKGHRPWRGDEREQRRDQRAAPAADRRPERPKAERPLKPDRAFKPDHPSRSDRPSRPDHPFKPDRPSKSDRPFNPDRPFPSERPFGSGRPFKKKAWRPQPRDRDGPVILYGWHSVKAAIENPARKFHRLIATENAVRRLTESGLSLPLAPELVRAEAIEALVGPEAVHQGLLAEADPLESPAIEDLAPTRLLLVLDQITDPHNVGAILRSAAAFGVEAVITTARHSPEMTGVLAKAASAALEYVPIVTVPNLARALRVLKDKDVFVVGLDSTGDTDLATIPLRAPLALVLGAEGKGLRQLTRTTCDAVARLDLPGRIKSLNVSNATALALYVASGRIGTG